MEDFVNRGIWISTIIVWDPRLTNPLFIFISVHVWENPERSFWVCWGHGTVGVLEMLK